VNYVIFIVGYVITYKTGFVNFVRQYIKIRGILICSCKYPDQDSVLKFLENVKTYLLTLTTLYKQIKNTECDLKELTKQMKY